MYWKMYWKKNGEGSCIKVFAIYRTVQLLTELGKLIDLLENLEFEHRDYPSQLPYFASSDYFPFPDLKMNLKGEKLWIFQKW